MNLDQWHAVSPYLDEALGMAAEERSIWLSSLHTQDSDLAEQLELLLRAHRALCEEGFLERRSVELPSAATLSGQNLGVYKLVSQIGQGGMSSVWLAQRNDGRFERQVAVKLLNIALMGKRGEERFKREGRILAHLAHPNIAELIDAGVSQAGQPYLILEYVEGEHVDRHCDQQNLNVEARIRIFLDVLAAVAHAHANLIVHRDLKPSNVLVTADGRVKLLDFGIANLFEVGSQREGSTSLTREGGGALTPEYAAPEQLKGEAVTTSTDVYALGVLLYELLTGCHPMGRRPRTPADLVESIVNVEPVRPSDAVALTQTTGENTGANSNRRSSTPDKLRRLLRGDLDTIVTKALKKEPKQRYPSVTALADDLLRYLKDEPISARPDTLAYSARKFVRRNRIAVALATMAVVATAAGVAGTLVQTRRAREQRDFAFRQLARAETVDDLNEFLLSEAAPSGKPFTVDDLLVRAEHVIERQQDKHDPRRIELLISLGRQYNVLDEQAKSRQLLQEAYGLSREMEDPSTRARASCALGSALALAGQNHRAEELVQEGLKELGTESRFVSDRMFCWWRGTEVARERGDARSAITRTLEAQRLARLLPFKSEVIESYLLMDLAESYRFAGRYGDANAAFEEAASRLAALGRDDTQAAATLFNNWGNVLILAGRPLDSARAFRHALDISRVGKDEDAVPPTLLVSYARALRELHQTGDAADYAERGYTKALQLGAEEVVAQSLLLRSAIYVDQGDLQRAEAMLNEVEPMVRGHLPPEHIAYGSLASCRALVAEARGDLRVANAFSSRAVDISEAAAKAGRLGGDYLPTFLVRRSEVELKLGRSDLADADAARAVQLLQHSSRVGEYSSTAGHSYLALGLALRHEGKKNEARAAFVAAVEHLQDSVGPDHPDTRNAQMLAQGVSPSR